MTHILGVDPDGNQFGFIIPGPYVVFPDDYAQITRTLDGLVLPVDFFDDIGFGGADMVSAWSTPPPVPGLYNTLATATIQPVSTFYKVGDTDGTPTGTRLPPEIRPFALVHDNLRGSFELTITADTPDGLTVYDSTAHTLDQTLFFQDAVGSDLRDNDAFMAAVTSTQLRVSVAADGPIDGYWLLYTFGFRYTLVPAVVPPLRQWPRDDGLRRTPRGTTTGSRQGSLRRGPRGNYT